MARLIERDESGFWSLRGVSWRNLQEGETQKNKKGGGDTNG